MLKSRRSFLKLAALSACALPKYAFCFNGADDRIKVAIVGCGRSGRRAACAMPKADSNISIIALADAFADCAFGLRDDLARTIGASNFGGNRVFDVPDSRVFVGLDSYKAAVDCGADAVVFATPPVFRPREFEAAVSAGKHAFLEKPVCVDPVQARKMWELARLAKEEKLTAVCGLQRRYHAGYREAMKRLHDGQIGRVISAQCFWLLSHFDGMELKTPPGADPEQLEYQLRNWALFTWACGDHIVEQQVHNLDVMRWAFGRDPLHVLGVGGRSVDLPMPEYGNRFSHFSVDYDYGDGVHLQAVCRQEPNTAQFVAERFVGTDGVLETSLFSRQTMRGKVNWTYDDAPDCIVEEYGEFLRSVRGGAALNTVAESTDSAMMAVAGRLSAYSGLKFKYEWAKRRSNESLFPKELKFGRMPVAALPVPGKYKLV